MPAAFPFRWAGRSPYEETRALATDVLMAEDGTEQRRQLRARPERTHAFDVEVFTAAEASRVQAALQALAGDAEVAVPFWPHVTPLAAAADAGAGTLSLDTTARDFYAGHWAMLWRSQDAYELVAIDAVGGASLTLDGVTDDAWPAGTYVVPCHAGRLVASLALDYRTPRSAAVPVRFALDPLQLPAVTGEPGALAEVFPIGPFPDRRGGVGDQLTRAIDAFANPAGGFTWLPRRAEPVPVLDHPLYLRGLAQVRALWAWYGAVLGRLTPSWVPSAQADLVLTADVAAASDELVIRWCGYTDELFPHLARRWLALWTGPGAVLQRRVEAAVDNLDGTETLTLSSAAGVDLPRQTVVSILRYARLLEDALTVAWASPAVARATPRFVELPWETAAFLSSETVTVGGEVVTVGGEPVYVTQ